MLNEVRRRKQNTVWFHLYAESKQDQQIYKPAKSRNGPHKHGEQTDGGRRGGGGGRAKWMEGDGRSRLPFRERMWDERHRTRNMVTGRDSVVRAPIRAASVMTKPTDLSNHYVVHLKLLQRCVSALFPAKKK